ncbi:MAG: ribonuclease H [Polyangiaceae bacterium]
MPWVTAKLRGQRVYARSDGQGKLVSEGGRVEIRYKPNDGRMYRAAARNLDVIDPTPLPDDTCAPAEGVQKAKSETAASTPEQAAKKKRAKKSNKWPAPKTTPSKEGEFVVYTDGACSSNPGPAGLGVVWLGPEGRSELSEFLGHGTNNIAELSAIGRALTRIPNAAPATIHTDSRYSIGVLQDGWKAKANQDLVASIRTQLEAHPRVRLVYVKGHAGIELNERADELARRAVETRSDSAS